MTFREYLEKNGPTIEEIAGVDCELRRVRAVGAFERWAYEKSKKPGTGSVGRRQTFNLAWDLAVEVMGYAHMAQDARAVQEKEQI